MANIQPIENGETGLDARTKINAAIVEANQVDSKVNDNDARLTNERTPTDGSVTNAKVAANAAIEPTKIAGTAVVDNDARLTDERVPIDGSVTNAKLQNVATSTIKGRITADTGLVEDLTVGQAQSLLNLPSDTVNDLSGKANKSGDTFTGNIVLQGVDLTGKIFGGTAHLISVNNEDDVLVGDSTKGTKIEGTTIKLLNENISPNEYLVTGGSTEVLSITSENLKTNLSLPSDTVSELAGKVSTSDSRLTDERVPIDDSVSTAKLQDASVTNSKLDTMQTNRLKGRQSSGTGVVEDLQLSTVKTMLDLPNDTAADLTAVETTANGALQRSGGEMTGAITGDQSARLYRPQGEMIDGSVSISVLDKNSFFEINAASALTITLDGLSEPNVVREFMITSGGEDRVTILNSTTSGMAVSGLGLLADGASFTVKSVGDAFTIRSRSNGRYVVVGGEFTLV